MNSNLEKWIRFLFRIGVWVKGIDGFFELVGGTLFWLVKPETFNQFIVFITQYELDEDPHDFLANWARHALHVTPQAQWYGFLFLFSHGLVKILIVLGLLRNRLWAYPTGIVIFGAFGAYQIYRYLAFHSALMLWLTILDVLFIALTWHEWQVAKAKNRIPLNYETPEK